VNSLEGKQSFVLLPGGANWPQRLAGVLRMPDIENSVVVVNSEAKRELVVRAAIRAGKSLTVATESEVVAALNAQGDGNE